MQHNSLLAVASPNTQNWTVILTDHFFSTAIQRRECNLARQQQFLNLFLSLPFDDEAAMVYGKIRAALAAQGTPIGSNDLQIAAIALVNDLTLVTHNMGEFSRVLGLRLEDWELG